MRPNLLISFLTFLFVSNSAWSRDTQIGECLKSGNPIVEAEGQDQKYPKQIEFRCLYVCRLPNTSEELIEASYEYRVENKSERFEKLRCEGDSENDGIFFSRLSDSKDLRNWANDNQIAYEGPYNGQLTKDTLSNLLYTGRKLAATKSIITSRAGHILIKIGSETDEGKQLFEAYLFELRSGGYQQRGFSSSDDWVLHFIALYGRHLF